MLERVVVPIADEATFLPAFDYAAHLARRTAARVTVLTVVEQAEERDAATAMLDRLLDDRGPDVRVTRTVRLGQPAQRICEALRDGDASLLAMATRAARPVGEAVFGSVAGEVLRRVDRPVLLVGPGCRALPGAPAVRRLLVCLDGSEVANAILPVAAELARSLDASLLLYFVGYPLVDTPTPTAVLGEEDRAVAHEVGRHAAELRGQQTDATHEIEAATWPAERILEKAAGGGIDLIAMATHGRHALVRMLTGSTTHEVLRRAAVPVLTVRPSAMLH